MDSFSFQVLFGMAKLIFLLEKPLAISYFLLINDNKYMSYFLRPLIYSAMDFLDGSDSNNPTKEGQIGENLLNNVILNYFTKRSLHYKVVKNIRIFYDQNKTTEIDAVLFTNKGIFVIENKHWNGIIKGKIDGDKWLRVQDGYRFSRIYHYPNPYKQNEFHLSIVKKLLGEEMPIFSLITFSSNNIGRTPVKNLINLVGFPSYMDNFDEGAYLADDEIDRLNDLLISHLSVAEV